jgi:hypothetical protein
MLCKVRRFEASEFTPTQWDTAQQKADFANHFSRFIDSEFSVNVLRTISNKSPDCGLKHKLASMITFVPPGRLRYEKVDYKHVLAFPSKP